MKFEVTVKVLQGIRSGIGLNTGNPFRYQGVILETQDGDHSARWLASLGTEMVDKVEREGIKVGDRVLVDLTFTTVVNYNKFVDNKVYVKDITKSPGSQTPQPLHFETNQKLGGAGMGEASQQYPPIQYPKA